MTNVSFDQNHGSGEQNAPTLLGGRRGQHAAALQWLAPALCRTRLLEMLRWISLVRSNHQLLFLVPARSSSGAPPAACRSFPGSLLLRPVAQARGIPLAGLWMGANRKIGVSVAYIHKEIQTIPECKAGIPSACKRSPCSHCG